MQMGPSGSGKTTLLGNQHSSLFMTYANESCMLYKCDTADVLALRKTTGELSGQILIGGKPPSRRFMRRYTGYVEQFGDLLQCCHAIPEPCSLK